MGGERTMSNLKNVQDIDEDITYFDFKGYELRIEMSDYDNGNLTIRVKTKDNDDWEHKYTVVDEEESEK
jgi:hypothetical protein